MAAPKLKVGQETDVPLGALQSDPDQPRKSFDGDALEVLAASIKTSGVLVPLLVRKGEKGALIIVDGERRWRAAKIAGKRQVPVILQDWDTFDAADRSISQLAINNVRESLKPMELAALVHRLRTTDKLTTNDIAARLAKMGVQMSVKEINAAGDLLTLPKDAQRMLDEKQLDTAGAKALLIARRDPEVLETAVKKLVHSVGMRGRVTANDVVYAVEEAYGSKAHDLQRFYSYGSERPAVHFDYRKVCKGCEHLRRVGDGAFCVNTELFEQHNREAIEAGLEPGGRKPVKVERAEGGASKESERAEAKEASHAQKVADYFDTWLRRAIGDLLPTKPDLVENLRDYFAAAMPDGRQARWGDETPRTRAGLHDCHNRIRVNHAVEGLMQVMARSSLTEFVGQPLEPEEKLAVAQACLQALRPAQVLELARAINLDVVASYSLDAEYLDLKSGAQLRALADQFEIADLPSKVGELREHLLAFENAQRIGLPPDLRAILEAPPETPVEDFEDDEVDDDEDLEEAA